MLLACLDVLSEFCATGQCGSVNYKNKTAIFLIHYLRIRYTAIPVNNKLGATAPMKGGS